MVLSVSRAGESQGLLLGTTSRPFRLPPADPRLPTGGHRGIPEPLASSGAPACSFDYPICVYPAVGAKPSDVLESLDALELAYSRTVVAMGLAPPRRAIGASSARLTVLLDDSRAVEEREAVSVQAVPVALGSFDAASAVCHLRGGLHGGALERAATICVGESLALGLDPGMSHHLRRAYATHLWWAVGGARLEDAAAVGLFQLAPEVAVFGAERTPSSEGAALLFEFLDVQGSRPWSCELSTALVSRAGSRTRPSASRWNNEPDIVDVVRSSFEETSLPWPRLLGEFALARGLLGSRASEWESLGSGWSAPLYRPRFDWKIRLSSLPRRLLTREPIAPTGSTFVWVDFDVGVQQDATLGIRAECEAPVAFQWEVAKLEGAELKPRRVPVVFESRSQRMERTVSNLERTRALLIAGTNVGGVSASFPFDPDLTPYEPHACTVYLALL